MSHSQREGGGPVPHGPRRAEEGAPNRGGTVRDFMFRARAAAIAGEVPGLVRTLVSVLRLQPTRRDVARQALDLIALVDPAGAEESPDLARLKARFEEVLGPP